jgi:hypothetical protein
VSIFIYFFLFKLAETLTHDDESLAMLPKKNGMSRHKMQIQLNKLQSFSGKKFSAFFQTRFPVFQLVEIFKLTSLQTSVCIGTQAFLRTSYKTIAPPFLIP